MTTTQGTMPGLVTPEQLAPHDSAAEVTFEQRTTQLIAQLATAGHHVSRFGQGFLASRWGLTLHCPDLASLAQFARQVGVKHDPA